MGFRPCLPLGGPALAVLKRPWQSGSLIIPEYTALPTPSTWLRIYIHNIHICIIHAYVYIVRRACACRAKAAPSRASAAAPSARRARRRPSAPAGTSSCPSRASTPRASAPTTRPPAVPTPRSRRKPIAIAYALRRAHVSIRYSSEHPASEWRGACRTPPAAWLANRVLLEYRSSTPEYPELRSSTPECRLSTACVLPAAVTSERCLAIDKCDSPSACQGALQLAAADAPTASADAMQVSALTRRSAKKALPSGPSRVLTVSTSEGTQGCLGYSGVLGGCPAKH
jgi:hypothetical protein